MLTRRRNFNRFWQYEAVTTALHRSLYTRANNVFSSLECSSFGCPPHTEFSPRHAGSFFFLSTTASTHLRLGEDPSSFTTSEQICLRGVPALRSAQISLLAHASKRAYEAIFLARNLVSTSGMMGWWRDQLAGWSLMLVSLWSLPRCIKTCQSGFPQIAVVTSHIHMLKQIAPCPRKLKLLARVETNSKWGGTAAKTRPVTTDP